MRVGIIKPFERLVLLPANRVRLGNPHAHIDGILGFEMYQSRVRFLHGVERWIDDRQSREFATPGRLLEHFRERFLDLPFGQQDDAKIVVGRFVGRRNFQRTARGLLRFGKPAQA